MAAGIVRALEIYLGIGGAVAIAFALFGVARVDAGAKGSGPLFRVLIVPGAALLWPLVALRWARSLRERAPK